MIDRGIIKWLPFDSCYSSSKIVKEIKKEKEKAILPILSDDQLMVIENKIKDAYELRYSIQIKYFYNDSINIINGKINGINLAEKKIYINNKSIYLRQILEIT